MIISTLMQLVPSSDHCHTETVLSPSDHCCIETVSPSGDHYCIDIVVPSRDHCCNETVPPSSEHYGTSKVAPPSDHLHDFNVDSNNVNKCECDQFKQLWHSRITCDAIDSNNMM